MKKLSITGFLLLAIYLLSCNYEMTTDIGGSQLVLPELIDFNFHIKPILSDKCFKCHGPDENTREAGLAFHKENFAFKALNAAKTRFAIVAGDTAKSQLLFCCSFFA